MVSIKRSISFALENKKVNGKETNKKKRDTTETCRVRCTVTWHGNRARLNVPHQVNPDGWEPTLQRCRARTTHGKLKTPASVINHEIDMIEETVDSVFRRFEDSDVVPTRDEFAEAYDRIANPDKYKDEKISSLFPVYDKFYNDGLRIGRWSEGTEKVVRTVRNHLHSINENMTFEDLEKLGIAGLLDYFATVSDKDNEKGLNNRTIRKDIGFVCTFLRWAHENGFCEQSKLINQKVNLKIAKKPVIFLTWEELMKVYNYDFGVKNYLNHVRNVFCFCCFTSLRYSDVLNLRKSNISEDAITITTVKTHDTITIELNRFSREILERYSSATFPDDRALPVISNQKMNHYLKELGQICGLDTPVAITTYKGNRRIDKVYKKWELLSSHAARRTFVCNALMLGIPPNIVMKWTGHSDYNAMRPYIEIADDAKKSAMSAFDKLGQN